MRRYRLFSRLYLSYMVLVFLALAGLMWYVSGAAREMIFTQVGNALEAKARIAAHSAEGMLAGDPARVDPFCKEFGPVAGARVTVIAADGKVLGDSQESPSRMASHADRPEIREALLGQVGMSRRHSETLQVDMMYVAVPIMRGHDIIGVARAAEPLTMIAESLRSIDIQLLTGGAVIAGLAAMIGLAMSRGIMRPIREIARGAARFASGDLKTRLPVPRSREIARLAETLNKMAAELDARIQTMVRQKNEQEAILSSMAEGVIAVDADEHIITMNQSAAKIFDAQMTNSADRPLQEVIRNIELQRFMQRALSSTEPVEDDVVTTSDSRRVLRAYGVALRDPQQNRIGAVVVLNDVTRLMKLENLRREFVGNVSHELKTPITSIKGFVETLLDGALDNHEEAVRFLKVIASHADRLTAIIEDLLLLSRVEQNSEQTALFIERTPIVNVLSSAVRACETKAMKKSIPLSINCSADIEADIDAHLFEQAVVNLIDNAIKYSEPGKPIEVSGESLDGGIRVVVRDNGCGIPAEHLPRVFERFYRVDKARSRKNGGTGLGLAIVKHIIQAHGGTVTVESKVGNGSAFTLHLPKHGG